MGTNVCCDVIGRTSQLRTIRREATLDITETRKMGRAQTIILKLYNPFFHTENRLGASPATNVTRRIDQFPCVENLEIDGSSNDKL